MKKLKRVENYEINPSTMFIIPVKFGNKIYSRIYEEDGEFLSPLKPTDIIKKNCKYFGVDFDTRRKGTKEFIGYTRKLPIIMEPINHIIFIPMTSPNDHNCIWIANAHVDIFNPVGTQETKVLFINGQCHTFPVPPSTFKMQVLKASYLHMKFLQRIDFKKKKSFLLIPESKTSEKSEFYLRDWK